MSDDYDYPGPSDSYRVAHVRPSRRRVRRDDADTAPPFYVQQRTYLMPEDSMTGRSRSASTGARALPLRRPVITHANTERGRPNSYIYDDEQEYYGSRDPSPYSGYSAYSGRSRSRATSRRRSYAGSRDPSPYYERYPEEVIVEDPRVQQMENQLIRVNKEKRLEREEAKRKEILRQAKLDAEEDAKKRAQKLKDEDDRLKREVEERAEKLEQKRKDEEAKRKAHDKLVIEAYEKKQKEEKQKKDNEQKKREEELNEALRKKFAGKIPDSELDRIITGKDQKEKEAWKLLGFQPGMPLPPTPNQMPPPPPQHPLPPGAPLFQPPGVPFQPPAGLPFQPPAGSPFQPPAGSPFQQPIDMSKPVHLRISRQHLSTKSLDYYRVPYKLDEYDRAFIVVLQFYPDEERQKWFNHTDWLRTQRTRYAPPPAAPEFVEWNEQQAIADIKKNRRKSATVKEDPVRPKGAWLNWMAGT
ncbi:MAG: hypothetical protein M1814_003005 [Vezdaea aestivalis]|nr:MAG: hypothetical protein M1814_003005 [Vezdaea aestivalis]